MAATSNGAVHRSDDQSSGGVPLRTSSRAMRTTPNATPAITTAASAPGRPYLRAGTDWARAAGGEDAVGCGDDESVDNGGWATRGLGPAGLGVGVVSPTVSGGGLVTDSGLLLSDGAGDGDDEFDGALDGDDVCVGVDDGVEDGAASTTMVPDAELTESWPV